MNAEMLDRLHGMREARETFALATVIRVHGSASARPGSCALISKEGRNLLGWVGGGCAESFVCNQAVEAMTEKKTRIVTADLDDEVFGLGMPCGGIMDVYIEPYSPQATFHLRSHDEVARQAAALARHFGFRIVAEAVSRKDLNDPGLIDEYSAAPASESVGDVVWPPRELVKFDSPIETAMLALGQELIRSRKLSGRPLVELKGIGRVAPLNLEKLIEPHLLVLGHSRITEEIAFLGAWLKWPTTVNGSGTDNGVYPPGTNLISDDPGFDNFPVDEKSCVIIASHHKGDHLSLERAIGAKAPYVGLVASAKRSKLVFNYFVERGHRAEELAAVRAPAGLEMDCQSPAEIALSIVCEILAARRS